MVIFNSYGFMLAFLPVTLVVYFSAGRAKAGQLGIAILAVASILFAACSNLQSAAVLTVSAAADYWLGHQVYRKHGTAKKAWLIAALILNIGTLAYFKYINFLADSISGLFGLENPWIRVSLPVGLSFYTFHQIAYLVDIYRGETAPCSFGEYLLYIAFFPKLVQGPITQPQKLIPQFTDLSRKSFRCDNFAKGLSLFAVGLAKKVLLADNFGKIVDYGYGHIASLNSFEALLAIAGYAFQIYFDFSGYCDMAVGAALMFNIELPQNFNSPYKALSISEFWKRWHITLTGFLTKYVYIPLGGSRKGSARTYLNILVVFFISGLWHGAGYTFLLWGLMHGIAMVLDRMFQKRYERLPKGIRWVLTFVFVTIAWVFFRADCIADAIAMLNQVLAGGWSMTINAELTETLLQPAFISIAGRLLGLPVVVILSCTAALFAVLFPKNSTDRLNTFRSSRGTWLQTYFLLTLSILSISGISTFLYSNF